MIKTLATSLAAVLLLMSSHAMPQTAPVKCEAKGYWTAAGVVLNLRSLNLVTGIVDIDGVPEDPGNRGGGADSNARWSFFDTEGVLHLNYERRQTRSSLVVGPNFLRGSYEKFNSPAQSRPDVIYNCDGPTERIILRR